LETVASVAEGRMVFPRIVHSRAGQKLPREAPAPVGVSDEALAAVRAGMDAVMNEPGGTGYGSRIPDPAMAYAGKTGTAQVRRITAQERATGVITNAQLPWRLRDHALFVAYGPVVAPRYAISVVVEHGGGGAAVAAPIARDILRFAQERDVLGIPTAYPVAALDTGGRRA